MSDIEKLSAELHAVYQIESKRQHLELGFPVRHDDDYNKLSENTKEYDRVLARYILEREKDKDSEISRLKDMELFYKAELEHAKDRIKEIDGKLAKAREALEKIKCDHSGAWENCSCSFEFEEIAEKALKDIE